MLTKLAKWFKAFTKDLSKTDMERFLEHSADIHDLEKRIHYWERRNNSFSSNGRYY